MTASKGKYTELASRIEAAQTIIAAVARRLKNRSDREPQHLQLAQADDLLKTAQENVRELRDAAYPRKPE